MPHANDAMTSAGESPLAGRRIAVLAPHRREPVAHLHPPHAPNNPGPPVDLI